MSSAVIKQTWGMFHKVTSQRVWGWPNLAFKSGDLNPEILLSAPGTIGLNTSAKEIIDAINELHASVMASRATGVMFLYTAAQTQNIYATNYYHEAIGFGAGAEMHGVAFKGSLIGFVTNTADNGGILRCTDGAHGLDTGDYITLASMGDAAHRGTTRVTVIDINTFDCDDIAWSSNGDSGNYQRGSSLTILPGFGGVYYCSFSASMLSSGNNKNYQLELVRNATDLDEIVAERMMAVLNDLGPVPSSGFATLNDGDVLRLLIKGTTDTTNCVFQHANLNIHRV